MRGTRFEWDEAKNRSNQRKHGISFDEAIAVFQDASASSLLDRIVNGEERWQTIGRIGGEFIIAVAHTWFADDIGMESIRVISARRATPTERRDYEKQDG